MSKSAGLLLGLFLAAIICLPALALDANGLTASVSVATDERFRGVSQSARHAVPEAEIDYVAGDGWSGGSFVSAVDFKDHENTSLETDFYLTKEFDLDDTSLSVEAYYYGYPNHHPPAGARRYSAVEGIATASRTLGDWGLTASVATSPDYADESGTSAYASAGVSYAVNPDLSVSGNLGRLWVTDWDRMVRGGYPYTHWDIGLTYTMKPVSFDLRLIGTSLTPAQCLAVEGGSHWCDTAVVATVSYAFGDAPGGASP